MYPERMPNLYTLEKDIQDRLSYSIIRYDGVPYLAVYEKKGKLGLFHPVTSEKFGDIKFDDPLLDISSIEVGYMNLNTAFTGNKNKVFYLVRNTKKKYAQGLTSGNLLGFTIDNEACNLTLDIDVTRTKGFYESITGEFPIISDLLNTMRAGEQWAVAQDVALRKSRLGLTTLFYRTKELGYFEEGSDTFKCKDKYLWVFERYLSRFNLKME